MRLKTRAENRARDERMMQLLAEGVSLESIAEQLHFANVQVVRVKICKMKRKEREKAAA